MSAGALARGRERADGLNMNGAFTLPAVCSIVTSTLHRRQIFTDVHVPAVLTFVRAILKESTGMKRVESTSKWCALLPLLAIVLLGAGPVRQAAGSRERAGEVVGGPYVVNVGPRSATVMWLVQTGQASIGTEPDKMEKTAPVLRAEKIQFNGLTPATTYYYESFPGQGGRGSFKTAPVGPAQFVRLGQRPLLRDQQ